MKETEKTESLKNAEDALARIIGENRQAMSDFNSAMKVREEVSIRIGTRTTHIIRFGTVGLLLIVLALFYLIYTLTGNMRAITMHMVDVSANIQQMTTQFENVTQDIRGMRTAMESMNNNISTMNKSILVVPNMNHTIVQINDELSKMNQSVGHLNSNIYNMDGKIGRMDQRFSVLIDQMGAMTNDVDRMSAPMRFFPFR
jgi:uncharacterized protein YoxC